MLIVSYGALANLPVDKPINHSGLIMSLWFYLLLYFLLLKTKVCFQQSTWNLETAEVLQDILCGGK